MSHIIKIKIMILEEYDKLNNLLAVLKHNTIDINESQLDEYIETHIQNIDDVQRKIRLYLHLYFNYYNEELFELFKDNKSYLQMILEDDN